MKTFIIILIFICYPFTAHAQNMSAGSLIQSGCNSYMEGNDPKLAIQAWIKNSGIDGSKEALSQSNILTQIQDFYGAFEGCDIIKEHDISTRTKSILLVMNYAKGALFANFFVYKNADEQWLTTSFDFQTKAQLIFPNDIVFGAD